MNIRIKKVENGYLISNTKALFIKKRYIAKTIDEVIEETTKIIKQGLK